MKVIQGLTHIPASLRGCVLTIGNFDGVHRGHQQIIAQAGMIGQNRDADVVVMTFDPHPLEVILASRAPARLMPLEERIRCLFQAGADWVVVVRSEPALLSISSESFVEQIIVEKFGACCVVEGPSFRFGKNRLGTPDLLITMGRRYGFEMCVVDSVNLRIADAQTVLVSSSLIRELVAAGRVHQARLCLGRAYSIFGRVQTGHTRGQKIGFPTANLGQIEQLLPAEGVYGGVAEVADKRYPAAISIGQNPTFDGQSLQVEAHLLGCTGSIYGQRIRLALCEYFRPQEKFFSSELLRQQIEKDVEEVRKLSGEVIDVDRC